MCSVAEHAALSYLILFKLCLFQLFICHLMPASNPPTASVFPETTNKNCSRWRSPSVDVARSAGYKCASVVRLVAGRCELMCPPLEASNQFRHDPNTQSIKCDCGENVFPASRNKREEKLPRLKRIRVVLRRAANVYPPYNT